MTDEDALLAAICDHPLEDTLRLAFADFLQEQGGTMNTGWPTLIRSEINLAAGVGDEATHRQRVRMLQSRFWKDQIAERLGVRLDTGVAVDLWDRGFPTYISGRHAVLRDFWPRAITRIPVRLLRLDGVTDDAVEDTVTWPRLRQLTSLELNTWAPGVHGSWYWRLGDRAVTALAECPEVTGLESLNMGYASITETGVTALVASRYLPAKLNLRLRRYYNEDPLLPDDQERLRNRFASVAF